MKIELRKLKVDRRQSEETTAFTAELYIDGVHAAHVSNSGKGGSHRISPIPNQRGVNMRNFEKVLHAQAFFEKQPDHVLTIGRESHRIPMTLDLKITLLVDEHEAKREEEKLNKKARGMLAGRAPTTRTFIVRYADTLNQYDAITFSELEDPMAVGAAYLKKYNSPNKLVSARDAETREQRLQRWATMPQLLTPAMQVEVDTAIEKGEISGAAVLRTLEALNGRRA